MPRAKKIGAVSILITMLGGAGTFAKGFVENLNAKVQDSEKRIIILETKEITSKELMTEVRDDVKKLLMKEGLK